MNYRKFGDELFVRTHRNPQGKDENRKRPSLPRKVGDRGESITKKKIPKMMIIKLMIKLP